MTLIFAAILIFLVVINVRQARAQQLAESK